jgi:hypothetical protein
LAGYESTNVGASFTFFAQKASNPTKKKHGLHMLRIHQRNLANFQKKLMTRNP